MSIEPLLNKIHHADCLDFMRQMPDKCVDLVLTDPPYFGIVKNKWDNQWETMSDFQKWAEQIGIEIKRVLKDSGSFYWFGDDKNIAYCQVVFDKHFRLLNNVVWEKPNGMCAKGANSVYRAYAPVTERILFYDKGESLTGLEMVKSIMPNPFADYLKKELMDYFITTSKLRKFVVKEMKLDSAMVNRWFDGNCLMTEDKYNFIRLKTGKLKREYEDLRREYEDLRREYEDLRRPWNNSACAIDIIKFGICQDKGRFHPTQKPLALISYLIERSSNEGKIVFDPFSGSGTTAVACHNLNRQFICIEKDKGYWEASIQRLEEHKKQLTFLIKNFYEQPLKQSLLFKEGVA